MNILTISGSTRSRSSNTLLLKSLSSSAPYGVSINHSEFIEKLPIFNPDHEGSNTPAVVLSFCEAVGAADGLIIASPEYVHAIPGGLKNAIDWLVSREEIINKPIALAHASHRGDDMLHSLRQVLSTVSSQFSEDVFLRLPLMSGTGVELDNIVSDEKNRRAMTEFIRLFMVHCLSRITIRPDQSSPDS